MLLLVFLKAYLNLPQCKNITYQGIEKKKLGSFPGHYLRESFLYSEAIFNSIANSGNEYDIIYIQGFAGWKTINHKKELKGDPVLVLNFHGLEMFQRAADTNSFLKQLMFRPFVKSLLKKADFVQSLGGKLTDILKSFNISNNKILIHGNGIEEGSIKQSSLIVNNPRAFVFIGRFERRKGIIELNNALKAIEGKTFVFHFIGPIPDSQKLASPNINYHGQIKDQNKIFEILDHCDVLVCPSYSEGMPTVI